MTTPDDKAREIVERSAEILSGDIRSAMKGFRNDIEIELRQAIAEAVAAEREACAKVAGNYNHGDHFTAGGIATAIRNRTD